MGVLSNILSSETQLPDYLFFVLDKIGYHFSSIDNIYDPNLKKPVPRWTLLLPGAGCAWAKTKDGGCYMCGFAKAAANITGGKILKSQELLKYYKINENYVARNNPRIITIYSGGSFLNSSEVPFDAQMEIFRELANHPTVETVFVETRPEYIDEQNLSSLLKMLGKKKLVVGIGLECKSDEIREKFINKGFTKKMYEAAVTILKKHYVGVATYVFVKPLFLSEKEAIEESVRTTSYAFERCSDEVVLEAAFVQKKTTMEKYYRSKQYTPPWLWSIVEVLKRTRHLGPVRVGDFSDFPTPVALPKNCPDCTIKVKQVFGFYKTSLDVSLFNFLKCDCQKKWQKLIQ
jgi:radical SAM enzyme (TIGR01210 family)